MGLREGWSWLGRHWDATVARVAVLDPADQRRRVDDEWSALETLRHLVFVADAWFRRSVLGLADAFDPMGLTATGASELGQDPAAMGLDHSADPDLDEILAVRGSQRAEVSHFLASVTDSDLAQPGWRAALAGWPVDPSQRTIAECLHALMSEEWEHRRFCERDLDRLTGGRAAE